MEVENEAQGEVQVKLVLHVGNRQAEVVNYSETDKNKFSLKTLPKAQRTRGLSSYHRISIN